MGGTAVKSAQRDSDTTRRIDEDFVAAQKQSKRRALRFRRGVRTLGQTIFYGFVAGALFFCAVRFALEAAFPGTIQRFVGPIVEPVLHTADGLTAAKKDNDTDKTTPKPAPKHPKGKRNHRPGTH
jgi:hypothetical protein